MSVSRESVRDAYSSAAKEPSLEHAFPVGREFALSLGYPAGLLARLPDAAVGAFSGVADMSTSEILRGSTVLDMGCGAGMDSLIASRRTGPEGRVIGIDFSPAMIGRAAGAATEDALSNVAFVLGSAEALPVRDRWADVALVNGIFNLNIDRDAIFAELARTVRPGGTAYAAELVLREPHDTQGDDPASWFA